MTILGLSRIFLFYIHSQEVFAQDFTSMLFSAKEVCLFIFRLLLDLQTFPSEQLYLNYIPDSKRKQNKLIAERLHVDRDINCN